MESEKVVYEVLRFQYRAKIPEQISDSDKLHSRWTIGPEGGIPAAPAAPEERHQLPAARLLSSAPGQRPVPAMSSPINENDTACPARCQDGETKETRRARESLSERKRCTSTCLFSPISALQRPSRGWLYCSSSLWNHKHFLRTWVT